VEAARQKEINAHQEPVILAAHSVGGSVLLKYLSEIKPEKPIAGVFRIAVHMLGVPAAGLLICIHPDASLCSQPNL
jgi:predicted alpha/beta hydrolase family esterase